MRSLLMNSCLFGGDATRLPCTRTDSAQAEQKKKNGDPHATTICSHKGALLKRNWDGGYPPSQGSLSEREACAELHRTTTNCGRPNGRSARLNRTDGRPNATRTGRVSANRKAAGWQLEARMVEQIVRIGPDLQADVLMDGKRLAKGEVDLLQPRPIQSVTPEGAEGSIGRLGKSSFVEPLIRPVVGSSIRKLGIPNQIGVPAPSLRIRVVGLHRYSKRLAALQDERTRTLPATENFIEERIVVQEHLPFAEGQLVNSTSLERIPHVEV